MPQVIVKGLSQYGVITDVPPFETPANAWTEVRNCSFENGGIAKSGTRAEVMIASPDEVNKIYCKGGIVYFGTSNKIYRCNGVANLDVSRSTAYLDSQLEWFTTELSNVLVFTNEANVPQMLLPDEVNFQDLTAWGIENPTEEAPTVDWRTSKIRAFKNFLIALGMTENGKEYKQRVRWSDIALPNDAPPTWDSTDTTKSAGFNDLSEAKGEIIDGLPMGEYFIVYTTKEVFLMSYVAGNDIFTFRKIFDDISLLAPECVAQVPGGHFLITNSDIVIHNGSSYQSIITDKIKTNLFQYLNTGGADKIRVQNYPAKQEVWVYYPSSKNAYLDRAAIYSLTTNTWTFRELPNVTAVTYGQIPSDDELVYDLQDYTFDSDTNTYNGIGQDFARGSMLVSTYEKVWWAVDEGTGGTVNLPSVAVKQNIDFDDQGLEATSHKMVRSVYPQIQGSGLMYISIGTAENPYDSPNWTESQVFDISKDRKVDFRVTGRYISVRFESFDKDYWTLTSYGIDIVPRGTR